MVPLDRFVTARLDDEESQAAAATPDWRVHVDGSEAAWLVMGEQYDDQDPPDAEDLAGEFSHAVNAEHAARHSPARTLREVAAHRRIVAAYRDARTPTQRAALGVALKAVAGIWAEHPDYDPTWRL